MKDVIVYLSSERKDNDKRKCKERELQLIFQILSATLTCAFRLIVLLSDVTLSNPKNL